MRLRSGGGGGPCSPGVSPHLLYSLPRVLPPCIPRDLFPCLLLPDPRLAAGVLMEAACSSLCRGNH